MLSPSSEFYLPKLFMCEVKQRLRKDVIKFIQKGQTIFRIIYIKALAQRANLLLKEI